MYRVIFILHLSSILLIFSCSNNTDVVVYETNFDHVNELNNWHFEIENDSGDVTVNNGYLDIDVAEGATVWFKKELHAPVLIEYTAILIDEGGKNDRVSDLNCFWMASDPRCPENILICSDKRSGNFGDYHTLRTYYVGYGGHNNSKTRFRRYDGKGGRFLLPEHDLSDPSFLLEPNQPVKIELLVNENKVQFIRDGHIVFDIHDKNTYKEGWFGFRTVHNHMKILDFKVIQKNS